MSQAMSTLPPYMLQEYHQDIISAMWMIILSLIPLDPIWAGAILQSFLICVHVMRPRIEYQHTIILLAWMILLSLILDLVSAPSEVIFNLVQAGAILLYVHVMRPRIEYHEAITLVVWMLLQLSLIQLAWVASGAIFLVRFVAVHLVILIWVFAMTLLLILGRQTLNLFKKQSQDAVGYASIGYNDQFTTDTGSFVDIVS